MGCDRKLSKINLYRILQESLQNCNKYANATLIDVELKKKAIRLCYQLETMV
jgi:signal transduction histidine kinase